MLSLKHLSMVLTTFVFSLVALIGCGAQNEIEVNGKKVESVKLEGKVVISASISKVGENMSDIKEPHGEYTQENTDVLRTFVDAINRAEKLAGIVDVATPHYQFTLTFENKTSAQYFLWLGDDHGSLMHAEDTHYLYTLPEDLLKDLDEYVQ
ncbi:hypothetical protein ACFYKX_03610 [Cytobacillus sp. FJAT-54145]|uniref:YhfM-like domain-containing protein n=1 Tax=Cytobacillus spartinae TaxID=3299023 RepID=A0ABW6K9V5_9BACI